MKNTRNAIILMLFWAAIANAQSPNLDAKIYTCNGQNLERLAMYLRQKYADTPIKLLADNKISVVAPEDVQLAIRNELLQSRVLLETPLGSDPRVLSVGDGTRTEFSAQTGLAAQAAPIRLSVDLQQITLQQLESTLGALFGDRLERLQGTSPQYRYAVQKNALRKECFLQFDDAAKKVHVSGDAALCRQFESLLHKISQPKTTPNKERKIMSIRDTDAEKIRRILEVDQQKPQRSGMRPVPDQRRAAIPVAIPAAIPIMPYRGQDSEVSEDAGADLGTDIIDSATGRNVDLLPDLNFQILPDLDVIIFDGPGAEVARLMRMIDTIQQLSKNAEPKVEIYFLKHVDCLSVRYVIESVGQNIMRTKQGYVVIFPMMNPNAILLIGWGKSFDAMKDLVETFDQPIAAENSKLRIFRLKHASATYISRLINSNFPVPPVQGSGFLPRIQTFPDMRSNAIVVQASPNDMQIVIKLVEELDVDTSGAKLSVRQYKLKHSYANDLGDVLSDILTVGSSGIGVTEDRKLPSFVIERITEGRRQLIESGIVSDVQISRDVRNNLIIVTAPEKSHELIAELIQMLDVPPAVADIKIFRMLNADATAMLATLQSLIPSQAANQSGPQLSIAESGESLIPVRFVVDQRTNCIIAAGSRHDLTNVVEPLIVYLDRQDIDKRIRKVYPLRNSEAADVALAVNEYLRSKRDIQRAIPTMISPFHQIESEVIVVAEGVSNSLIIEASPNNIEEILKVIADLDRETPQVVIQVLIAEIALNNTHEFGAEFGFQDSLLFNRSTFNSAGEGNPGFNFNNPGSSMGNNNSNTDPSNVLPQMLTNFATGAVGDGGISGLVFSASSDAVSIMLRALQQCNRLEVLSRPQITALDNQQAYILVGQRVPRVTGVNLTNYGTQSSTTMENVGLILIVTPRISPTGNKIVLSIAAEKSKLSSEDGVVVGTSTTANTAPIKSPIVNQIRTQTIVSASDNETVLLGGLISKEKEEIKRKVPFIADIPIVGKLFQYKKNLDKRSELLIILTPKIVREAADMERIKQLEAARMSWCLSEVEKIHGSTGLYDVYSEETVEIMDPSNLHELKMPSYPK